MTNKNNQTTVLTGHDFSEYKRRYGRYQKLLCYRKDELIQYELKKGHIPIDDYNEYELLNNRTWWLIDNVFYEIPKKNFLGIMYLGTKQSVFLHSFLISGITASIVLAPSLVVTNSCSIPFAVEINSLYLGQIQISETRQASNGDLSFFVTAKKEGEAVSEVELAISGINLIENIDYSFDKDTGEAIINRTYLNSHPGNVIVTPKLAISVQNVSLDISLISLSIKNNVRPRQQLTAIIYPENATNKNVKWKSSNTNVATVNKNGVVLAVSNGETTITATTEDGGFVSSSQVVVTSLVDHITLDKENVNLLITSEVSNPYSTISATVDPFYASNPHVLYSINENDKQYISIIINADNTCTIVAHDNTPTGYVAKVKVSSEDGGCVTYCQVTVSTDI